MGARAICLMSVGLSLRGCSVVSICWASVLVSGVGFLDVAGM